MGLYSFDDFQDYQQPYDWWGYHCSAPVPLSVVELIGLKSLDASLAALLWLLIEQRVSIVVAAVRPLAGKSTTLNAMLDFLPPNVKKIYLRGGAETFEFAGRVTPEESYLLCNEISPDLPAYIWGRKASTLFQLLGDGYRLGSTMHAGSVESLIGVLEASLGVPHALIARLTLVLMLDSTWTGWGNIRSVRSLHLLQREADRGVSAVALAERAGDALAHNPGPALDYLASEGIAREWSRAELERRRRFLDGLHQDGITGMAQVREAIGGYRGGAAV